jgi:hypothetical protein
LPGSFRKPRLLPAKKEKKRKTKGRRKKEPFCHEMYLKIPLLCQDLKMSNYSKLVKPRCKEVSAALHFLWNGYHQYMDF